MKRLTLIISIVLTGLSSNASLPAVVGNEVLKRSAIEAITVIAQNREQQDALMSKQPENVEALRPFINKVANQIDILSSLAQQSNNQALKDAVKNLVSAQQASNRVFMSLQLAAATDNRQFQTLSNVSKAKHDVAMNAIRNMK